MSEWNQWFLRAITNDGKKFTFDCERTVAILGFKNIYESVTGGILPTLEALHNTLKTEIFLQFTDPNGVVVKIDLCQNVFKDEILVLNSMWFETDREDRIKLVTEHPVTLVYSFADAIKHLDGELHAIVMEHESIHEAFQRFHQEEMSQDYHMGYFDPAKDLVDNLKMKVKVAKSREPGDNSGVFEFHPYVEKSDEPCIQVGSSPHLVKEDIHNHSDIYSAEPLVKQQYRIYVNGHEIKDLVDDISWMGLVHNNVADGLTSINDVQGFMEMEQWIYDMLDRFLRIRDFKIGAHPAEEILEDGNDAKYSLFWGHQEKETIHITPLTPERDRDDFNFDDVNF